MATTVITGCLLNDRAQVRCVNGDLWEEGDVWIFNACLIDGETGWMYKGGAAPPDFVKQLVILDEPGNYFERRGVIVLAKVACRLNSAALEYLK